MTPEEMDWVGLTTWAADAERARRHLRIVADSSAGRTGWAARIALEEIAYLTRQLRATETRCLDLQAGEDAVIEG